MFKGQLSMHLDLSHSSSDITISSMIHYVCPTRSAATQLVQKYSNNSAHVTGKVTDK